MRKLMFLLRKEFRQIRRNPFLARAIIAVPIVQMLILVPAVTLEIKKVELAVVDNDHSSESRGLVSKLAGSSFFDISRISGNINESEAMLLSGDADMVLIIPPDFSEGLAGMNQPRLQVLADAVNSTSAQLAWNYIASVIRDFNIDEITAGRKLPVTQAPFNHPGYESAIIPADMTADETELTSGTMIPAGSAGIPAMAAGSMPGLTLLPRFWYNPTLNYKYFMLPGILVILVTAIGLLMSGLNIVREKENGTMEQINVTPVMKWELIASKMIPFFVIGLLDLVLGLTIGWLAFDIPFEGSLLLFFTCAAIFLVAVLGMAVFLSTLATTQQQFLFVSYFIMMILILISGIFTPAESMPLWAQHFNLVNPVAYLMRINRMIMLKGSGLSDISADMGMLFILAVSFLTLSIRTYRKRG